MYPKIVSQLNDIFSADNERLHIYIPYMHSKIIILTKNTNLYVTFCRTNKLHMLIMTHLLPVKMGWGTISLKTGQSDRCK